MIVSWIIYLTMIISTSVIVGYICKYNKKSVFVRCNLIEANFRQPSRILGIVFASILPILIGSFRYGVGTDYFSYYRGIQNYIGFNISSEIGSQTLQYIAAQVFDSPQAFFCITTIISIGTILWATYRVSGYVPMGYAIFMFLCMDYAPSLNIVRQYMAVGVVLLAYTYMEEKKFKTFLILVLIAFSFHTSAIVVLPIYLITTEKYGKSSKKAILILSTLAVVAYRPLMDIAMSIGIGNAYEVYFLNYSIFDPKEVIIPIVKFIPIMLIIAVYQKRLIKYNNSNIMYIYMVFIGFVLQLTAINGPFIERIAVYLTICQIILVPQVIKLTRNKFENFLIKLFIISYSLLYFTIYYGVLNHAKIFPYRSIFSI